MTRSLTWLVATRCESVAHDEECHEWVFSFERQLALRIASPWRVRHPDGGIALGWLDHGQQFGLPSAVDGGVQAHSLLGGSAIVTAEADEVSGDLSIRTERGVELQVFNASSGYEGWLLYGKEGRTIVGTGGGGIAD